ncbi:MAG: PIN domain-containing protein [Polyangiaceae bacterium]|nr:PIN domain-containing protein [Polyangiaceae bacterium]
MKIAFDSSVIIAGTHDMHPHHRRAIVWIDAVIERRLTGMITWHALAEIWSVLTRMPAPARLSPEQAMRVVRQLRGVFELVQLEPSTYTEALERCTNRGFHSGVVFDALHLVCAEHAGANGIVTFNGADFVRLATPTSPRIIVPPNPPHVAI